MLMCHKKCVIKRKVKFEEYNSCLKEIFNTQSSFAVPKNKIYASFYHIKFKTNRSFNNSHLIIRLI